MWSCDTAHNEYWLTDWSIGSIDWLTDWVLLVPESEFDHNTAWPEALVQLTAAAARFWFECFGGFQYSRNNFWWNQAEMQSKSHFWWSGNTEKQESDELSSVLLVKQYSRSNSLLGPITPSLSDWPTERMTEWAMTEWATNNWMIEWMLTDEVSYTVTIGDCQYRASRSVSPVTLYHNHHHHMVSTLWKRSSSRSLNAERAVGVSAVICCKPRKPSLVICRVEWVAISFLISMSKENGPEVPVHTFLYL